MSEGEDCEDPESPNAMAGRPAGAQAPTIAGPVLETDRLILRRPQAADAGDIAWLADDRRAAGHLVGMRHSCRGGHAAGWIGAGEGGQQHLVCLKRPAGAPRPIGVATLEPAAERAAGQLGCWLGEAVWGQGFATEACHALVDFAFLHQAYERLSFSCRVTDPAGRRVAEKCGFQLAAQELARLSGGDLVPVDRFQLDRRTWASLRGWAPLRLHVNDGGRVRPVAAW